MTSRFASLLQRTTERQRRLAYAAVVALLFAGIVLPGELKASVEGQLWARFPWSGAAHFTLFAVIAAFPVYGRGAPALARAALLACVLAVLTELVQGLVPGRHPMVRDVLIDLSGTTLGLFFQQPITRMVHASPRVRKPPHPSLRDQGTQLEFPPKGRATGMKIMLKSCGDCDLSQLERLPRSWWMRWLPGLRHYHCDQCRSAMLAPKRLVDSRKWAMSTFKGVQAPAQDPTSR